MASPSAEAHNAAVKKAAELSGLVAESVVSATASSIKSLTLSNVHELPFSSRFFVHDGGPAVRYEFFYDPDAPTMAVRIVTTLGEEPSMIIGGVLASRIAFYAMELLEGNAELSKGSPAAREGKFAPLNFGLRQQFNFLAEIIPGTLIRILYAYLSMLVDKICGIPPPADPTLVHDAKSLFQFYECPRADELAALQVYRLQPGASAPGDEKSFRKFLRLVDAWRQVRNLAGYFYLINFSPMVAPGVTDNAQDITSLESRYRGALDRPGCGPPPPLWTVSNPQLSRRLFLTTMASTNTRFPLNLWLTFGIGSRWQRLCTALAASLSTASSWAGSVACRRRLRRVTLHHGWANLWLVQHKTPSGSSVWDCPRALRRKNEEEKGLHKINKMKHCRATPDSQLRRENGEIMAAWQQADECTVRSAQRGN
jgi:hypothetical protein